MAIDRLIDDRFPNVDYAAQLRHEVRQELTEQTTNAARLGGVVMAFFLMTNEEHPISANMTCYDLTGLMALPDELDPTVILAEYVGDKDLAESLPSLGEGMMPDEVRSAINSSTVDDSDDSEALGTRAHKSETAIYDLRNRFMNRPDIIEELDRLATEVNDLDSDKEWIRVETHGMLSYRTHYVIEGNDHFGEDTPKIPSLQIHYLQVIPHFGLLQTTFSTPLIQLQEFWFSLFDAIVATFRSGAPEVEEFMAAPQEVRHG
ncbi:MAG: hypothetical protein LBG99_03050 [Propionibacteriaceae bacterium]|nr:hypothetical protein [Propionibacteriaceae bacterium]